MKAEKKCKHGIKTRIIEKHQVSQPWITRDIIDHCWRKKNSMVAIVNGERNEVGDGVMDEWKMSTMNEQVSGENEMLIFLCVFGIWCHVL